ncbi:MAG: hypothetical protein ACM31L_02975 [Actinomycetota bacterium]
MLFAAASPSHALRAAPTRADPDFELVLAMVADEFGIRPEDLSKSPPCWTAAGARLAVAHLSRVVTRTPRKVVAARLGNCGGSTLRRMHDRSLLLMRDDLWASRMDRLLLGLSERLLIRTDADHD